MGYSPFVEGQVVDPISVSTDKGYYFEGDTILVTGNVSENLSGYSISIEVFAPNGDKVATDQVFPNTDKTFRTQFTAGGNLMEFAGEYTIKVFYATESRTASTTFQYILTADQKSFGIAPFVDPAKNPQSYVDRYFNDSEYKAWFDSNYPQFDSIYEAVGLEKPKSGLMEITVTTNKFSYNAGEEILIFGKVKEKIHDQVFLYIFSPKGIVFYHNALSVDDYNNFKLKITTTEELWREASSGNYLISVFYGEYIQHARTGFQYFTSGSIIQPPKSLDEPKDLDSDYDRVPDSEDQCPSHPELHNGYLDNDGCPDHPEAKTLIQKESLEGDEYIPIVYSIDFEKRPLIGISFGDDDEQFKKMIPTIKKGIELWTVPLELKFGGDWSVDYVIMESITQTKVTPDIIFNIENIETSEKCLEHRAYAHQPREYDPINKITQGKTPLNIVHCVRLESMADEKNFPYNSIMGYERTNAHEFFHSLGFGHTIAKELDFMCGNNDGEYTCPLENRKNYTYEEIERARSVSDFDLTAIAYLYGVDGFQNPNKPTLGDLKFTADDYLNFDPSTYTLTYEISETSNILAEQNLIEKYNSGELSKGELASQIMKIREKKESKILPPLKQVGSGIPIENIKCSENLHLIFKATDNSPACVKLSTAQKLLVRGWTMLGNP